MAGATTQKRSLPIAVAGARVRLGVGGLSMVPGPGQLGREGAAGVILFSAAEGIWLKDLFAAYWLDEAPGLDWRRDFLCGSEMADLLEQLWAQEDDEEAEEEEILYAKAYLTTLGSEVMDDV